MSIRTLLTPVCALVLAVTAHAGDAPAAEPAKAKPYPLNTCLVTDEALDSMGGAITTIHDGQEVKFCCKGCITSFNKDPAKYIKKMAEQAAKAAPAKPAGGHNHGDHQH
jgi:hypothetical protein